ncbi:hypothetical protein B0H13DRAFT_1879306 [Mycena leptocephala]|nr:hypothetical protein B0H13DRAFT_1879306 [Mycena leptocephala]
MLSDGARRLSSSLLSATLGAADSPFSDDKHGQNAANALENAVFTAAAGDLPAYQQIFRHIYLDLKTQRIEIQVIGRSGFTARFSLRRRSKISRVRAAVAQLFDDPTARFFWRSPAWRMLSDQDTPYSLCMGNRETVYYAGHIVVVHEIVTTTAHSKPSKTTFGVAPTYTLESLRKFFLPGYKHPGTASAKIFPSQMRDRCCVRGEIPSLDELFNPMAECEDLDAQYLRFSDGKEGITKILEYMKASGADGDEGEEEEPAEVEFDFDKKEVLVAAELLERVLRFRPDFDAALPLGDQLRKFHSELKQEIEENQARIWHNTEFAAIPGTRNSMALKEHAVSGCRHSPFLARKASKT